MFKIPTYEEIEKKESDIGSKRTALQNELFQKRKLQASSTSEESDSKIVNSSAFSHKPTESESKQAKLDEQHPKEASSRVNKPPTIQPGDEDNDDDDNLLHAFIQENKEILEKKPVVENVKKDDMTQKPNDDLVFKKPELPRTVLNKPPSSTTTTTTTTSSSSSGFSGGSGPLVVNSKQRGNPILKHIRNVQWKFSDTLTPDYCMSRSSCAFYLSMKYHLLNPTYIHQRIKELGRAYDLRVLLVFVDVKEPRYCIKELEQISIICNLTMILCWTNEEVGRYLETYKAYEFKSAEAIMEKSSATSTATTNQNVKDSNFISTYTDFLSQIKSINKTDASTLRHTFGSIKQISKASKDELNLCPGLGPLKVNRLYEIFRTPFVLKKN